MKKMNKIISISLVFGALFYISSCSSSKLDEYQFEPRVPNRYVVLDSLVAVDTVSIAETNWRNYFNDGQLTGLIEQGIKHNFDMSLALKDIEIAKLRAEQTKLEWLPTIGSTVAGAAYQFRSENYYSNPSSNWYENSGKEAPSSMHVQSVQNITDINFSWEIDIWGKFKNKEAQALAEYLETEEAKKAIQTELVAQIAESYYSLILLNAQLEVARTNYSLSENTYKILQLQFDAGEVTALAKQQTKSQMLTAKALIPTMKQQIGLQENRLNLLTGNFPTSLGISPEKLDEVTFADSLTTGVPLQLLKNRPDIKAAELTLQSKNASAGVTQKMMYPSLQIDLSGGVNSMLAKNWFNIPGSLFGGVVAGVSQPIFNKGKLKTNHKTALLERDKAEINLQRTVNNAIIEVTDALVILHTLEEQLEIAEEQVENSLLAVKQSNMLFENGFATYLEVINAQRSALENELNYNQLKLNKLVARIQLYKALGGGWVDYEDLND